MQAQADDFVSMGSDTAHERTSSLRTLSRLGSAECEALFGNAEAFPFEALAGHPRGRVLAVPGREQGAVGKVLRALHASPVWIWEGKSFATRAGAAEGVGINRIRWFGTRPIYPFRTYPTASLVDGKPCFAIDYDLPQNPARVRPVYDEVRRVDSGLYLGRGMRRSSRQPTPRLILWFALDMTIQDRAVKFGDR